MPENKTITISNKRQFDNLLGAIREDTLVEDAEIKVSDCNLRSRDINNLVTALRDYNELTSVSLEIKNIRVNAVNITPFVEGERTPKGLILNKTRLQNEGAKQLARGLHENNHNTLSVLGIRDDAINEHGTETIADNLKPSRTLTSLDLSYNRSIGNEGAEHIATMLEDNVRLTELVIQNIGIDDKGAEHIANALQSNTRLTSLNLRYNPIKDEGAKHIAAALKVNTSLTTLNLRSCGIEDDGALALAETLKENRHLTDLDLAHNNITDAAIEKIADILEDNKSLTHLNLTGNIISDDGAKALIKMLQKNTGITTLKYRKAGVSEEVQKAIQDCLDHNILYNDSGLRAAFEEYKERYDKTLKRLEEQESREGQLQELLSQPNAKKYYYNTLAHLNRLYLAAQLNKTSFYSANIKSLVTARKGMKLTRHVVTMVNGTLIPIPFVGLIKGGIGVGDVATWQLSEIQARTQLEGVLKLFGDGSTSKETIDSIFEQVAQKLTEELLEHSIDGDEALLKRRLRSMEKAIITGKLEDFITHDHYKNHKEKYLVHALIYAAEDRLEHAEREFNPNTENETPRQQIGNTGQEVSFAQDPEPTKPKKASFIMGIFKKGSKIFGSVIKVFSKNGRTNASAGSGGVDVSRLSHAPEAVTLTNPATATVSVEGALGEIYPGLFEEISVSGKDKGRIQRHLRIAIEEKVPKDPAFRTAFLEGDFDTVYDELKTALETQLKVSATLTLDNARHVVEELARCLAEQQQQRKPQQKRY